MSRATSTKSWLWHRMLSYLNFGTINQLTSKDLVDGLLKFKYNKDHLCSACEQGKSKKASLPPKLVPSTESKLELLHMDLCGPMRVASINGKKYILVIVDDYSRYTWVYFLRTKDETPDMIIDFKFLEISQRIEEDYHSIKDDIPLVSVYTTGDVHVRGMLIPDAFLTEEIYATDNFKEYETVFMSVDVLMNQPQLVVSTQGTHRSTPRAHRIPTLAASPQGKKRKQSDEESSSPRQSHKITIKRKKPSTTPILPPTEAQENIAKVQEKLAEEDIEKMVEGDEDEESYASDFVDSVLNDDVDDSSTRLEPGSHKENPKKVNDDDVEIEKERKDDIEIEKERKDDIEIEKEKKDDVEIEKEQNNEEIENEKNNDNVEETDKVVKEKYIVNNVTGSTKIKKEHKHTPIPSPTRSPRNVSSSAKTVFEELTATATPTTATTSKASSTTKCKKQSISFRSKTLPGSNAGMCRRRGLICFHIKNKFVTHEFFMSNIYEVIDHCNKVVLYTTFAKTKEMITQEMPRLVNLAINKDREVDPINAQEMIAKEFATHRPKTIEELFRKHMQNTTLNLYPTTSTSTAGKSSAHLQHQLYLNMKSKPQD
ncbi:retrovirus-related pol polyprotein from transposon TNT 1-94 [Tanacetum coccineum]